MRAPFRPVRDAFRLVVPHEGAAGIVLLFCVAVELLRLLRPGPLLWGFLPRFNEPLATLAIAMALIYGAYRAVYFHPFYRRDYREWLARTPWHAGRRLPFGPVHLVWQDLLIVGVLTALSLRMRTAVPHLAPLLFLVGYLVLLMLAHAATGQRAVAYIMALSLGGVVRFANETGVAVALMAALYALAMFGLRRSLAAFERWDLAWWQDQGVQEFFSSDWSKLQEIGRQKIVGWPWERLSAKRNDVSVSIGAGLAISVLVGWCLYALLYHLLRNAIGPPPRPEAVSAMLGGPCLAMMSIRLIRYCWGYAPPISVLGRLVTLRWIVPGYDQVFVAPVCVAIVAYYGPHALMMMGVPVLYAVPLLLALALWMCLTMPPSLEQWRLTGNHRITPAMQAQQNEVMQT